MVKFVSISQALLVAEYLSFSRAAQVLGITQSAVSRRVRELEELRARSGGMQISSGPAAVPAAPGAASEPVRRLQEAKQMLDSRLITDSEYESIKARILAGT